MGISSVQPLPHVGLQNFRLPGMSVLRGSGRIAAYVRSGGMQDYDPPEVAENLVSTTAAALTKVRSGRGDVIAYLDGHAENVSSTFLSGLPAGTKFVGLGEGSLRPQFTFNAAGSTLAVNAANVTFENLMFVAGANGVTKAINVTADRFTMRGCEFNVAAGTNLHTLIACELGAGAHNAQIVGNVFDGIVGEPITDGILIAAAVNKPCIAYNLMQFASATGTTASLIRATAAALRTYIGWNVLNNLVAASDYGIVIGDVALTGVIEYNRIGVLTNDAPASHGISLGTAAVPVLFENYVTTNPKFSGAIAPTADS